jgi:O-antigen/teichoic acid export membrane protein
VSNDTLAIALANAVLSIPLCMQWGVLGAAIGTAAATGTGMLVMNRYFHRRVGLNTPRFWLRIRHLLPAMIVPGVLAIVIAVFLYPSGYFQIAGIACIFVAVYGVSMWLFGLDRYERHLITDPLQKIVRRFKK